MNVYIKENVINQIINDSMLRMRLAIELKVGERGLKILAERNLQQQKPNSSLTRLAIINFFKGIGFSDDEIYYVEETAKTP